MVFEMGGNLYLMDLSNEKYKVVEIHAVSDLTLEKPRAVDVHGSIRDMTLSPGGSRVIFEARGELFNVPAREGFTVNLSRSSGAFDRQPAWSPDGKSVAFWSDRLGEYEIYVQSADGKGDARQITRRGKGFGYTLYWSPDSRKLAFIDEKNDISILDVETGQTQIAGNTLWNIGHGGRYGYPIAWSADSKWIAFTQGLENANSAVFVYNLETAKSKQATSGFYNYSYPVFSNDGNNLFYRTNRTFNASYSDMEDGTWIYPNSTRIAALALVGDATYLLEPENDEVEISEDKDDEDVNGKEESTGDGAEETRDQEKEDTMEEAAEKSGDDDVNVEIDFDELESRITLLPPDAGNFGGMASIDDKLVYLRRPNTGSGDRSSELRFYDFKEREDKEIISDVGLFKVSADGKKILVQSSGKYGVVDVKPMQKIDDAVPTGDMSMNLVPKEEWRQIFMDTWRRHRDFFYDPNMHGVDWEQLREQYGALIDDARSRWDVANIQSDLAAELSAGHTYPFGGDNESYKFVETGYLGVDWGQSDLG